MPQAVAKTATRALESVPWSVPFMFNLEFTGAMAPDSMNLETLS